jgi:hypothetical protein
LWKLDWEYEFPGWSDWNDEALPYITSFCALHPQWTESDFLQLLSKLKDVGLGWIREEGVLAKLKSL